MKNILLVEDDIFLLQMYVAKLMDSGFEVETAQDGKTALEMMKAKNYDLVLLDLVLPLMQGFEILEIARKDERMKNLKIVALTNLGQQDEIQRALDLGANDYLIKAHFTPTEIVAKVKNYLKD